MAEDEYDDPYYGVPLTDSDDDAGVLGESST